jgi:uncharacterized protein (TIGR03435 family)
MSELAIRLTPLVNRFVLDRTGLEGAFDLDLEWTPDQIPSDTPAEAMPARDGPSIFAALEEQLGLKLWGTRGQVEVLVIDHAEHPTKN